MGNRAVAPPNNTANKSRDVVPSIIGLLLMKDIPPNIEFMVNDLEFGDSFFIETNKIVTIIANDNIPAKEFASTGFNA